jgi:hypothetical protein
VEASTTGAYLDSGSKSGSDYPNVIVCTTPIECTSIAGTTDDIYINAAKTAKTDALLKSNGSIFSAITGNAGFYIDSKNEKKSLISCTSDGTCTAVAGNTGIGVGYISVLDAKKIISYSDSAFAEAAGYKIADTYYIDGSDPANKKIIECKTSVDCTNKSYTVSSKYTFFDNTGGVIITCSSSKCVGSKGLQYCYEETCKKVAGGDGITDGQYCISTNGKIYKSSCTLQTATEFTNEVTVDGSNFIYVLATTTAADVAIGDADGNYLYQCNSSNICEQVTEPGFFDGTNLLVNKGDNSYDKGTGGSKVYYLTKSNELIYCTGTTINTDCSRVTSPTGFYLNTGATDNLKKKIIECNGTTCALRDGANGEYYANSGADTTKPLIKCADSCVEAAVESGDVGTHFDSGNPGKVIECPTAGQACENPTANEGYYVISANDENIIQCKTVGGKINCSEVAHGGASSKPVYYLKGDSTISKLIKCNTSGCTVVDKPFKGYYISEVDGNPAVLSCNGTTCKAETSIATTCSKAGQVILYPTGEGQDSYVFALCSSTENSYLMIIIKSDGHYDSFYETLTLASASDFPGNSSQKTITVKAAEGHVFLLEDAKLPECGTNCQGTTDGKYCTYTDGVNLKINKSDGASCVTNEAFTTLLNTIFNSATETGDYPAYFKDDYDNTATVTEAFMSYMCTITVSGDTKTLNSCKLVKGYSTKTNYCSGWKGDKCSSTTCNNKSGRISENNVSFRGGNDVALPTAPATGNIVIYSEQPNECYGIPGGQYVYLSLTAKTALVSNEKGFLSQNVGYQINRSQIGDIHNALLSCTASGCTVQDSNEGYYLNGDNLNKSTKQLIKCGNSGCSYVAAADKAYYVDAVNPSKIIYCETASTCQSISHDATTYAPKHFLAKDDTSQEVITCTPNGCFEEDVNLHGYFINGAGTEGKSLIKCEGSSTKCSLVDDTDTYGSTVGKLKVVDGKVTMCVAVGCSGSGEVAIETTNAAPLYRTITLASKTNFPGATDTEIYVKIANDGSVILLEDNLTTNERKVSVKDNLDQYPTSDVEGQKVFFYYFEGDDAIGPYLYFPTWISKDIIAYQCTYVASDNLYGENTPAITKQKCLRVKGFVTLGDGSTVQCNGWLRDDCHLFTPKACAAGDEGKLGTGKKICFGETNTVLLPSSSQKTPNYMAFVQEGINSYYGKLKPDVLTYLELTSNSVIAIDPPPITEDGTVITDAQFVIQMGTEYKLYKYVKATSKYELDNTNGVYGTHRIGSTNTYIYYKALANDASTVLFDCYLGVCKKTQGYILVGTSIYSNVGSDAWADKTSDTSIVTTADAASGTVGKLKIITDGNNKLLKIGYKKAESAEGYEYGDSTSKYFFGTDTDLKLYKLGDGIVAIPKPDDGYYFIKNNLVVESGALVGEDKVDAKMVECSNGKCKVITPAAGYYANPIGVKLIKCTDNTISNCSFDNTAGYYIDNKNSLFYCNGTKCELKDEVGYFVNAGDTTTNKYIECTKTKCQAKPAPEASVTCTEGNIGKLVLDETVVKVCLANDIMVTFSSGSYMIAYQTGSAYKGYVTKISYSGILSVSETAIKLNFDNTYSNYCVTKATMEAAPKTQACTEGTQIEVMCNVDGVCLSADTTAETLPDSLRNVKVEEVSGEEESSSAADIKIECSVRDGSNCEETYYLIDKQNDYSVLEDGVGTLYQCVRNKNDQITCTENFSIGYFIVDSTRGYYCREEASAINCSLLGDRIKTTATTCSAVGDIIFNSSSNKLFFCQKSSGATTEAIELNSNNSGNYAIPKSTELDIFGLANNQYALITINDKIITFNNTYKNNLLYVYVNESQAGKNKLIEKGDTCPKTTGSSPTWDSDSIVELDCKNGKCDVVAPAA